MRVIVCDAGPIIHLYEAHCLHLLSRTGDLFLPHRVHQEVQTAIHMDIKWPDRFYCGKTINAARYLIESGTVNAC